MPPRSRKGWKSKADKLWSEYIRGRDKTCRKCGKKHATNSHHIISRRYHSTRFLPANGLGLCPSCHFYFHQNPVGSMNWLVDNLGQKHLDTLNELSQVVTKLDYEQICDSLKGGGI
jgi:hypothetical protein